MFSNENAAFLNEMINVEELEQKISPSASWDIVEISSATNS